LLAQRHRTFDPGCSQRVQQCHHIKIVQRSFIWISREHCSALGVPAYYKLHQLECDLGREAVEALVYAPHVPLPEVVHPPVTFRSERGLSIADGSVGNTALSIRSLERGRSGEQQQRAEVAAHMIG
jgi:hypothetical protein